MPVRALLWHATSVIDDHGQGKSQRALQQGWDYKRLPEQVLPWCHSARKASVWRGAWLRNALYLVLLSLPLVLTIMVGRLYAQAPLPDSEPAPVPAVSDPLETPVPLQERLLAPVPQQFNWLGREAPSNPLLEALLSLQDPSRLSVSASLMEEVSDNFAHDPNSGRIDYRTGVVLGTVYRVDTGHSFVSLANTVRTFYQLRTDRVRVGYVNLSLNTGYQAPPWSFGLTDRFVREDNTVQDVTSPFLRTRQNFLRNSVSPQVQYAISPRTAASLSYTNTLVMDEDRNQGITTSHGVSTGIHHQFSPNLTGNASYTFRTSGGSEASEGDSHRLATNLGYNYPFDPLTSVNLRVFSTFIEQSDGRGRISRTYGASIGVRRLLFGTVSLFASIGPAVYKRQGEGERFRVNWNASLDGPIPLFATPTLTLTLTTRQSVHDTVGEVNDVGLVLRQVVTVGLNYRPSAFWTARLYTEYSRNEVLEEVDTVGAARGRTDNLWTSGLTTSYTLTRVISLTGSYRYQRRDSNLAGNDFEENRVTVAVTGTFSVF